MACAVLAILVLIVILYLIAFIIQAAAKALDDMDRWLK